MKKRSTKALAVQATHSQPVADPATLQRLSEIQEQMADMCKPHYHEYYKVTNERGFVKITIPKKK